MNTDDLLEQMELDDLQDRVAEQIYATPIDYARSRGIRPQLVYYRLRAGQLESTTCACGRKVIIIEEADKIFRKPNV